jgi:hypothetical protein
MKCKKKYEEGGKVKRSRSKRVKDRAEDKMTKAQVSYTKAEQARKDSDSDKTGNMVDYANKMYRKAKNQEIRAKKLMAKYERLLEVEKVKQSK